MTVEQFGREYGALQMELDELRTQLTPLLERLDGIAVRASGLGHLADRDMDLYRISSGSLCPDGWNSAILLRLSDFDYLRGHSSSIRAIMDSIRDVGFWKE